MNKKYLLDFAENDEEKLEFSRMYDLFERCGNKNIQTFTPFLTPAMIVKAQRAFSGEENVGFYGGYDEAERKIMSFSPFYKIETDIISDYPIDALKIYTKDKKVFSHRDYLGSVLSLGIKREKTGDIIISDTCAYLMCTDDISEFLIYNFKKIAHSNIFVEKCEKTCYNFKKQFKEVNFTVSSLRLDAVVSSFTKKSRTQSADFIKKGIVNLNYLCETNVSKAVKDGDIISVKGFGKTVLKTDNLLTRKGRINITLKIYV